MLREVRVGVYYYPLNNELVRVIHSAVKVIHIMNGEVYCLRVDSDGKIYTSEFKLSDVENYLDLTCTVSNLKFIKGSAMRSLSKNIETVKYF